ncbi:MAG: TonB-dependent receptor [bacterium]
MRRLIVLLLALALPVLAWAQTGTVMGTVTAAGTGEALAAAQVQIVGTTMGAASDLAGDFVIMNVPAGTHTLRCSFLGYKLGTEEFTVSDGQTVTIDFQLESGFIAQKELTFFASRATERLTPVAFTDVDKSEITTRLGSRDLPMVLNTTPSVYATEAGGGAGDARINIRGFNQRNVAVMINGVPVNDMENGWVYWSNWDGLADVTSSIQVQRGLSAVNMAVPSVGGTMNILTDAAAMDRQFSSKTEVGTAGFLKESLSASTGLMNGKYAFSGSVVRKVGDGIADKTFTDAWAYFAGISYVMNENNKFDLTFFGAPQRHGQRSYMEPISTFSHDLAETSKVPAADFDDELGYNYNPNWGPVSSDNMKVANKEYYNGAEHDVKQDDFLMERENYFHKPQGNLNWYWKINERMNLASVAYLSIGKGGGTGGLGHFIYNDEGTIDFDAVIQRNLDVTPDADNERAGVTALRNSVNNHFWYGVISKFNYQPNDNLKTQVGIDIRQFKGDHFRELRNLLGADYWDDYGTKKGIGDKYSYDFSNFVSWMGGFAQAEYVMNDLTFVGMAGVSSVGYKHENYYGDLDGLKVEPDAILGYQVKGGANYNVNDQVNVYGNFGYQSKPPIFDGVIDDGNGTFNADPLNEKIIGFELGTGYTGMARKLSADANIYYTLWNDRTWNYYYTDPNTFEEFLYTLEGVDAVHSGFELTARYRPIQMFEADIMASIGNWIWANDVTATFRPESNPTDVQTVHLYIDGLKVSDAAQSTYSVGGTFFPMRGTYLNLTWKFYDQYYAAFDPTNRDDPTDTAQPWKATNYALVDLHAGYDVPNPYNLGVHVGIDVFNVLDTQYISDAEDGSNHGPSTALVFVGLPMRYNVSLTLTY